MLVITRRESEAVLINDTEIEVVVLGIYGRRVKLGIQAPDKISIHRREKFNTVMGIEKIPCVKPTEAMTTIPAASPH